MKGTKNKTKVPIEKKYECLECTKIFTSSEDPETCPKCGRKTIVQKFK